MSGVFRNIDPPPPPPHRGGRTHWLGGKGGGWSIARKRPDTALYSIYVSALWHTQSGESPGGGGGGGCWASLQKSFRRLFANCFLWTRLWTRIFCRHSVITATKVMRKSSYVWVWRVFCKKFHGDIFLKIISMKPGFTWAREGFKICPYTHTNVNIVQCFKCCKPNDKTYLQF